METLHEYYNFLILYTSTPLLLEGNVVLFYSANVSDKFSYRSLAGFIRIKVAHCWIHLFYLQLVKKTNCL